ncbi:MAG: rhamnogalacturonan acetylesterase [Tidjanibacter sp.]|nr:rhamnogalacturonan acetylesterase [Tidjanibacter sp.]
MNKKVMTVLAAMMVAASLTAQNQPQQNQPAGQKPPQGQQQQRQRRPDYRPVGSDNVKVDPQVEAVELARTIRPEAGSTRKGNNPVIFMIGDSTMRTGTKGNADNGQRGWGYYAVDLFDTDRISVENHAMGGTSSRTFYDRLWADVVKGVQPGDWMIIQIGHNDSGPYDTARSRNSIPGTGKESIEVVNETTGEKSVVYSYGEYIRRYVNETRARGGNPILLSLTPRDKWNEDGSLIRYNVDSYTPWLKTIAEELDVPFLDFNNAGSDKYEHVYDKKKVSLMFFSDNIHTSDFGARDNLATFEKLLRASDIKLKEYLLPEVTYKSEVREMGKSVLFLVGDRTMGGDNGSFGWGDAFVKMLNKKKVVVDDRTQSGLGTRTYLEAGHWDAVYESVEKGDYVFIQFGYDESGDINVGEARGVLDGNGDEKQVMLMEKTGRYNGIYTYGFYLRKYCMDIIEKGATPVVISYVPVLDERGMLADNADNYGKWAREAAKDAGALFIDLNKEAVDELDELPYSKLKKLFVGNDRLSKRGAAVMAEIVEDEIDDLDSRMENILK